MAASSGEPDSQMVCDMLDRYIKAGRDESLSMREATVDVGEADKEVGPMSFSCERCKWVCYF